MRSTMEIANRLAALDGQHRESEELDIDPMFGRRATLASFLPWEEVSRFFGVTALADYQSDLKAWPIGDPAPDLVMLQIDACLPSALAAAYTHRQFGALRAIEHLTEFAWLMGWDGVVEYALNARNFPQFGMPVVFRVLMELGISPRGLESPEGYVVTESWFDRMRQGYPCRVGCTAGCQIVRSYPAKGNATWSAHGELQRGTP